MCWFIGGIRNTNKVSVKFTKGQNLQKLVGNLEFWVFHNGAADKSVLLGHKPGVPHVSKNCIPSVFKGQNVRVLGLLKYGKLSHYDSSKRQEPLIRWKSVMSPKKAIPQVDMLENTLSSAAKLRVMCRDDGSLHADMNEKFH